MNDDEEWRELGDGWKYKQWHGDILLQHQCASDKRFAALAGDHEKVSLEPLTLSPSVLCQCGAHGYIRNGQWQPC